MNITTEKLKSFKEGYILDKWDMLAIKDTIKIQEELDNTPEMDKISIWPEKIKCIPGCVCDEAEELPCEIRSYNRAINETAVKLAKFLSGLQKKIGELLYYRICEDGVSINLPPDMPEKRYCNFLAKAITDHIKRELLGLNKNEKSLDK